MQEQVGKPTRSKLCVKMATAQVPGVQKSESLMYNIIINSRSTIHAQKKNRCFLIYLMVYAENSEYIAWGSEATRRK